MQDFFFACWLHRKCCKIVFIASFHFYKLDGQRISVNCEVVKVSYMYSLHFIQTTVCKP